MRSLPIATVRGIPLGIHWSFLIALPFLVLLFSQHLVVAAEIFHIPLGAIAGPLWLWGLVLTLLLFCAVLLHELAHALYARRAGARVVDITLLAIGGVSRVGEPDRPRDEAIMALVGPLVSLALGALSLALAFGLPMFSPELPLLLLVFGELNLVLGVFNLLPAFPMDGGRILRAALTGWLGASRATRTAGVVGKVFAVGFVLIGLFGGGLFLLLIGFFVYLGADAEVRHHEMRDMLRDVLVGDLMVKGNRSVGAHDNVLAVAEQMQAENQVAYPVTEGGHVLGILTLRDVSGIPLAQRQAVEAVDIAHRTAPLSPRDEVWKAFRVMGESAVPVLPVIDGGELVGSIDQAAILRGIELRGIDPHPPDRPERSHRPPAR